jgi:hypothetical protein
MLALKRKILVTKISHLEKRETMAELEKFVTFEERHLIRRVDDFEENITLVRANFDRFKRNSRYLETQIEKLEGRKLGMIRSLGEISDRIGMKESDIKILRDRATELQTYKLFTGLVTNFYGAVPEPARSMSAKKKVLCLPEKDRKLTKITSSCDCLEKKEEKNVEFKSSMSVSEVQPELAVGGSVYLTEETRKREAGPTSRMTGSVKLNLDLFVNGFETLEDRNFVLYETINMQELDIEELV